MASSGSKTSMRICVEPARMLAAMQPRAPKSGTRQRSSAVHACSATNSRALYQKLRCDSTHPFGAPVVPDVLEHRHGGIRRHVDSRERIGRHLLAASLHLLRAQTAGVAPGPEDNDVSQLRKR